MRGCLTDLSKKKKFSKEKNYELVLPMSQSIPVLREKLKNGKIGKTYSLAMTQIERVSAQDATEKKIVYAIESYSLDIWSFRPSLIFESDHNIGAQLQDLQDGQAPVSILYLAFVCTSLVRMFAHPCYHLSTIQG